MRKDLVEGFTDAEIRRLVEALLSQVLSGAPACLAILSCGPWALCSVSAFLLPYGNLPLQPSQLPPLL